MKKIAAKWFAAHIHKKNQRWINNAHQAQRTIFFQLLKQGQKTLFGKDHGFKNITNYQEFATAIPIRDYEQLRPYIDRMVAGEADILWPGKPLYYAKTSGTTSGAKYIPITKASMPTHITAARDALLNYIHRTGKTDFVTANRYFFSSPDFRAHGVALGRLSESLRTMSPGIYKKTECPVGKPIASRTGKLK